MNPRALLAAQALPARTGDSPRWHAMTISTTGQLQACCAVRVTGRFAFQDAKPIGEVGKHDRCGSPGCDYEFQVLGAYAHQEPPSKQ